MFALTQYDYVATALIILAVLAFGLLQARKLGLELRVSLMLAVTALVLGYFKYVTEVETPVDSSGYFELSFYETQFTLGTDFLPYFTGLLTRVLGFGFLPAMMFFSLLAVMSIQLYYAAFIRVGGRMLGMVGMAVFIGLLLTSVGFWGSGISKDAFTLLGVALFCWAFTKPGQRVWIVVLGIALVAVVRPHVAVIMIAAVGTAIALGRDAPLRERIAIIAIAALSTYFLVPIVIEYVGFGDVQSLEEVTLRVESYTMGYESTQSFVDISSLPIHLQIITYLFRPFPWEASSAFQLAASAQNMLVLLWLLLMVPSLFRRSADTRSSRQLAYLTLSLVGLIALAMTTANLGVSTRQKWTVVLPLLLAVTYAWTARRLHVRKLASAPRPSMHFGNRRNTPGLPAVNVQTVSESK